MKKTIMMSVFLFTMLYADISLEQIEEMVKQIHMKRPGVKLETLENTKEPFVQKAEEDNATTFIIPKKEDEKRFSLHAILNGRAYLNDRWVKEGDKILGFTLKYIGKYGVVLQSGNQIKKLFLQKKKDNFITIKEREE